MTHLILSYASKLTHQNFLQSINSKNNLWKQLNTQQIQFNSILFVIFINNLHICLYDDAFNNYLIKCMFGFTFGDAKIFCV